MLVNNFVKSLFSGRQITGLVREFLEFFNLEFTLAVFDPETGFVSVKVSFCKWKS